METTPTKSGHARLLTQEMDVCVGSAEVHQTVTSGQLRFHYRQLRRLAQTPTANTASLDEVPWPSRTSLDIPPVPHKSNKYSKTLSISKNVLGHSSVHTHKTTFNPQDGSQKQITTLLTFKNVCELDCNYFES